MGKAGERLLIRADASVRMGTGHVMRCLALAQAWQDRGGRVVYALAAHTPAIDARLHDEGMDVTILAADPGSLEDVAAAIEAAKAHGAPWIVLDGYQFDGSYQRAIKQAGLRLMVLDDFGHADHYWADVVLNQDMNADESLYRNREPATRLLLGANYVSLRREFRRMTPHRREIAVVARRLLVTLGGSDPDNVTEKVILALDRIAPEDLETVVLVGPSNPHGDRLEAALRACRGNVRLLYNPANIPELMAWCDMAVTAGGSTVWELASLATPSIVLVIADNQKHSVRVLHERGACVVLGDASEVTPEVLTRTILQCRDDRQCRMDLSNRLGSLVDGRGADRACEAMCGACLEAESRLSEGRSVAAGREELP